MPLGVALDTQDTALFAKVLKVAPFNDFVENLLPHLLGLDIEFRGQILELVTERIPSSCTLKFILSRRAIAVPEPTSNPADQRRLLKCSKDHLRVSKAR